MAGGDLRLPPRVIVSALGSAVVVAFLVVATHLATGQADTRQRLAAPHPASDRAVVSQSVANRLPHVPTVTTPRAVELAAVSLVSTIAPLVPTFSPAPAYVRHRDRGPPAAAGSGGRSS